MPEVDILWVPPPAELFHFLVTLGLTFVLGLEREEQADGKDTPLLAGVRTMPLVGLLAHALMLIGRGGLGLAALGFLVVGGFALVSYAAKLRAGRSGATTETTVLIAYTVGLLSARGDILTATALTVASVLLLTGKQPLHGLARRLPQAEITTFVTFLLLAAVILPALPHEDFTRFRLNPFDTWLVVVAVSAISYTSYVLQRLLPAERSLLLAGVLGGLYSSTATTVALARRSQSERRGGAHAGAIIVASGVAYLRVLGLVWTLSAAMGRQMAPLLLVMGGLAMLAGAALAWWRGRARGRAGRAAAPAAAEAETRHPLELRAALLFAVLYLGLQIVTQLVTETLGDRGLLGLAMLVGLTDITPFVLGLANTVGDGVPPAAVLAIVTALASNNVVKGVYALWLGSRETGMAALVGLVLLSALTVAAVLIG